MLLSTTFESENRSYERKWQNEKFLCRKFPREKHEMKFRKEMRFASKQYASSFEHQNLRRFLCVSDRVL